MVSRELFIKHCAVVCRRRTQRCNQILTKSDEICAPQRLVFMQRSTVSHSLVSVNDLSRLCVSFGSFVSAGTATLYEKRWWAKETSISALRKAGKIETTNARELSVQRSLFALCLECPGRRRRRCRRFLEA